MHYNRTPPCPSVDGVNGAPIGLILLGVYSEREKGNTMPKAYWVSAYRAVKDPDKLAAYAKLAGPAITAGGGRFLARGEPTKVYEHGLK